MPIPEARISDNGCYEVDVFVGLEKHGRNPYPIVTDQLATFENAGDYRWFKATVKTSLRAVEIAENPLVKEIHSA